MNDHLIVAVYVVLDDLLCALGLCIHPLAQTTDSEVLTLGLIAASTPSPTG